MALKLGRYTAKLIKACLGKSRHGAQQIEFLIEFVEGPNEGQRGNVFCYYTGDAAQYTLKTQRTVGWNPGMPINEIQNAGKLFDVEVSQEPSDDGARMFERLAIYPTRTDFQTPPDRRLTDEEAEAVITLAIERVKRDHARKVAAAESEGAELPDDDLPF